MSNCVNYAIIADDGYTIIQTGQCPSDLVDVQGGDDLSVVAPPGVSDDRHYYDDGEFIEYPPKPHGFYAFDFETRAWIDPRTPADLEAELQAKRDAAWLTKPDFLLACMGAGILTPADAAAAAQGIVPEPFQTAVDALDPMTQDYLAVIWPSATRIERMDPFIQTIAAVRGLSDELVDQLFGIETS